MAPAKSLNAFDHDHWHDYHYKGCGFAQLAPKIAIEIWQGCVTNSPISCVLLIVARCALQVVPGIRAGSRIVQDRRGEVYDDSLHPTPVRLPYTFVQRPHFRGGLLYVRWNGLPTFVASILRRIARKKLPSHKR